ncbi:MAG: hypothetical protein HOK93_06855 [Methylococcales bacterium]|nr:hypothetical protein [Methylococcales bacterium]MBT3698288.1 hypothetical protein [Methylococcales bacterium]MBT4348937.1 hypothetical protein [Methylococcales bacterium]MBT4664676.1 hypothetical protein [Methylococcales bacterium]MBT5437274.1 hypothetical protein [Methylococcales bacterium]
MTLNKITLAAAKTSSATQKTTISPKMAAFNHCNQYIEKLYLNEFTFEFSERPKGVYQNNRNFVINASAKVISGPDDFKNKGYICRIRYLFKNNYKRVENINSWSIIGISGLEDKLIELEE